jgi:hypothetical protein
MAAQHGSPTAQAGRIGDLISYQNDGKGSAAIAGKVKRV